MPSARAIIIESEEVGHVFICGVDIHHEVLELTFVILDGHIERAIISVAVQADLSSKIVCPFTAFVAPSTRIAVYTVRVPQLDQAITSRQLDSFQERVGMRVKNPILILPRISVQTWTASRHDILIAVVQLDKFPQFPSTHLLQPVVFSRCTG